MSVLSPPGPIDRRLVVTRTAHKPAGDLPSNSFPGVERRTFEGEAGEEFIKNLTGIHHAAESALRAMP